MVDLSHRDVNLVSPYRVIPTGVGVVRFITDQALVYEAGFTEDYTFLEENTYQFYLKEITGNSSSRDPKIMLTVGAIIEEFFNKNQSVALYICDTSDGRQAVRDRIFRGWFESSDKKDQYTLLHGEATFDGIGYFASIIVRNDNPDLQEVIDAFNSFKDMARAKYPDGIID